MKATITDVAKMAGVSMKTVSRVLNNEPNVSKKTREKVHTVAAELKYSPNLAARGLASSKSYLVGLVYDSPQPCYLHKIQSGAIHACRKFGYHLIPVPLQISPLEEQGNQAEKLRLLLHSLPVDGIVLTPPLSDCQSVIAVLESMKIPFVLVSPSEEGSGRQVVKMDEVQAAREMTNHLITQGHKSIGFLKGPKDHGASALRYEGFRDAMAEARLTVHDHDVKQCDFSFLSGIRAGEELLSDLNARSSAILASNDEMAAGVLSVAARLGLSVPNDLSICGFENTTLAQILFPSLTSIQQPIYEMGFQAVETLVDPAQLTHPPVTRTLDFKLIVRESSQRQNR